MDKPDVLQQRFMTLVTAADPRSALCYDMSLRGSRRVDPTFALDSHAFPPGITVGGLSDDED